MLPFFSYNQDSCHFYFLHQWRNIQPKQCDLVKWAHGSHFITQRLCFMKSSSPRGAQLCSQLFTSYSPRCQQFLWLLKVSYVMCHSRATTYYLADRRYDMLPSILSADLCSLLGGVDRYAVSVMWELDKTSYEIKKVWYGRTIIRSAYKLFYEAAQELLDGNFSIVDDIPEFKTLEEQNRQAKLEELVWAIGKLTDIARHIRAKRDRCGALELEGVEVRVQLDDKKNIHDLIPKQPLEVHETVAECMILANHWVAKKIWESFPHQALLRQHPPPHQEFFSELRECAKAKGFFIDTR